MHGLINGLKCRLLHASACKWKRIQNQLLINFKTVLWKIKWKREYDIYLSAVCCLAIPYLVPCSLLSCILFPVDQSSVPCLLYSLLSPVSCFLYPVSFPLSHVPFCLLSPVPCILSPVPCHMSPLSPMYPFPVPYLISPVHCLLSLSTSHCPQFSASVPFLLSHNPCFLSPVSCPLSIFA